MSYRQRQGGAVGAASGKLLLSTQKPELEHADYNWSTGKVHDIAYLGGHSVYYVELPSGLVVQAFMANSERHGKRPTWDDAGVPVLGRRQRRGTAVMKIGS